MRTSILGLILYALMLSAGWPLVLAARGRLRLYRERGNWHVKVLSAISIAALVSCIFGTWTMFCFGVFVYIVTGLLIIHFTEQSPVFPAE